MPPTAHHSTLRVVVLAGGSSAEREVSLRSGAGVAAALAEAGHQASIVDPAECPLDEVSWSAFDACFVALHGGAGEDGRVQQELERLQVPYTGSGPPACRLAMSKSAAKAQFAQHGIPTPPYEFILREELAGEVARRVECLGYPLVLKPDAEGSSVGVAVANGPNQLAPALALARKSFGPTLVEPLIRGREFTVAVLDDVALPTIEIVTPEAVFSYDAKYHSSLTEYVFDFDLADDDHNAVRRAALGAAQSLGTCGLVRVDAILSRDGRAWVLEVNTVPGLTPRSLAPLAAARAGIEMPELCEMLVHRCLTATGVA